MSLLSVEKVLNLSSESTTSSLLIRELPKLTLLPMLDKSAFKIGETITKRNETTHPSRRPSESAHPSQPERPPVS
jgi:hypothetical protein